MIDTAPNYGKLDLKRKTGMEEFHRQGESLGPRLIDFWQWYSSDLVSNATRGCLAEFIVATALGVHHGLREEWSAFDLITEAGVKIEVKSSAYLQTWSQRTLSNINFTIKATRAWDYNTSTFEADVKRHADIYVFCVLNHQTKDEHFDPLNLAQWDFYLIRAAVLDERMPSAKTISLKALLGLGPTQANYEELRECIEALDLEARERAIERSQSDPAQVNGLATTMERPATSVSNHLTDALKMNAEKQPQPASIRSGSLIRAKLPGKLTSRPYRVESVFSSPPDNGDLGPEVERASPNCGEWTFVKLREMWRDLKGQYPLWLVSDNVHCVRAADLFEVDVLSKIAPKPGARAD